MSNDEIRIAIAEACGWTFYRGLHPDPLDCARKPGHDCQDDPSEVPNYPADLNAMHQAEKILTPEQCDKYELLLGVFALRTDGPEKRQFHKTSAQRAEAFLKTLGKWKGENE